MRTANENGVFEPELTEELARRSRSYAAVKIAQCDDGLFRYALEVMYSYGGFFGPITLQGEGYSTHKAAKDAARGEAVKPLPHRMDM
jgi:hypothetical protein